MKKILLSVSLVLFVVQNRAEASVQLYSLGAPITQAQLSFDVNNQLTSVAPATIDSIMSALNSGSVVTFTAHVSTDPNTNPVGWSSYTQQQSIYSLLASSPVWGSSQYPVMVNVFNVTSCSLNITGLSSVAMPMNDGETISVEMVISPTKMITAANNTSASRTIQFGANLNNISKLYVIDAVGKRFDASDVNTFKSANSNIASVSFLYDQKSLALPNSGYYFVLDYVTKYHTRYRSDASFVNPAQMSFPIRLFVDDVAVAVISDPLNNGLTYGWLLCRLVD